MSSQDSPRHNSDGDAPPPLPIRRSSPAQIKLPRLPPSMGRPSHTGIYIAHIKRISHDSSIEIHRMMPTPVPREIYPVTLTLSDNVVACEWVPQSDAELLVVLYRPGNGSILGILRIEEKGLTKFEEIAFSSEEATGLRMTKGCRGGLEVAVSIIRHESYRRRDLSTIKRHKTSQHILYTRLTHQRQHWSSTGPFHLLVPEPPVFFNSADPFGRAASDAFDISSHAIVFVGSPSEDFGFTRPYYMRLPSSGSITASPGASRVLSPLPSLPPETPLSHDKNRITQPVFLISNLPSKSGKTTIIRFSPNGTQVAFLHHPVSLSALSSIYVHSLDSLSANGGSTIPSFTIQNTIPESSTMPPASSFTWVGCSSQILTIVPHQGRMSLWLNILIDGLEPIQLTNGPGSVIGAQIVPGRFQEILVTGSSFNCAGWWRAVDVIKALSGLPSIIWEKKLAPEESIDLEEIWAVGEGDNVIHSLVIGPKGFTKQVGRPCVVMLEDEEDSLWKDEWNTRVNMALWAKQGFIVVCPNIAGSRGYGRDFAHRTDYVWSYTVEQDIFYLVDHLNTLPYIDSTRLAIFGSGYGATVLTHLMSTRIITRFRCAIWHGGSPSLRDSPLTFSSIMEEDGALLQAVPPTLMIRGKNDPECPADYAFALQMSLISQDHLCHRMNYVDEDHWFEVETNLRRWYSDMFRFVVEFTD